MSNSSDSPDFTPASSGSRFNRGFFIRIVAVALFLGLGTFAVSQSLKSKGDDHDGHNHGPEVATHESEDDDKNSDDEPQAQSAGVPKIDKSEFELKTNSQVTAAPRVENFTVDDTTHTHPKTADRRPSVVPREKNLVAKPAVVNQDTQDGGFAFNPRTSIADTAKPTVEEFKQNALDLEESIAEKSREVLASSSQSLSDLSLPKREPVADTENNAGNRFQVDPGGFAPRQTDSNTLTDNGFSPSPREEAAQQQAKSSAAFDPNRSLAPLNRAPLDRDEAKSVVDNPIGNRNAVSTDRPPEPENSRQFNSDFNVQPRAQSPQAGMQSGMQSQFPNVNRNLTPQNNRVQDSNTQLANPFQSAPQPAVQNPVQRQAIPAMNASTSRAIPAPAGGVRTLPTPGEKNLEGTRTPTLTIQRIAPREIQLNTPANFEFIVRNIGNIEANNVRIDDRIPTGSQLLEASPQPTQNAGGAVQWNIGTLAPGQERRIKLKLNPTQPGEIGSVAQISFGTFSSVRTLVTKPELEITHAAPAKSLIGDRVPLDIVVTNKGNGPAKRVIIQEDIPSQLEYNDGFRQIEYEIGTLAPGQSRKLQLVLKAGNIGKLRNVISANASGGLKAQHAINMEIIAPKLAAQSNGPRRRYLRRQATHEFVVQNNGTAAATNVELMAKLPPGLKYISSNNRGQYDAATNAVYWSLAELDPSVAATVELTTVPVSTGSQPINFTAVADLKQKASADAALNVEHLVDVFFDIDDVTDHIEIGSDTQYQVRIVNQGTKTATNVRLQLDLPPGIRPKDVEGGLQSQIRGQQVIFAPITSMNPGDEIKVAINATGITAGEHKVVASMQTDGRATSIQKEETTQVYSDR